MPKSNGVTTFQELNLLVSGTIVSKYSNNILTPSLIQTITKEMETIVGGEIGITSQFKIQKLTSLSCSIDISDVIVLEPILEITGAIEIIPADTKPMFP